MNTSTQLRSQLASIHRKSYPAYKSLKGSYDFQRYIFHIEHVQGDPFASPSNVRVFVPHSKANFPEEYYQSVHTRIALQDYLIRRMEKELSPHSFQAKVLERAEYSGSPTADRKFSSGQPAKSTGRGFTCVLKSDFPPMEERSMLQNWKKSFFLFSPTVFFTLSTTKSKSRYRSSSL